MLEFSVKGEMWFAYPAGLRFPRAFSRIYPLRGGGKVSKILYILNKLRIDRVLFKRENFGDNRHYPDLNDVAFFWPAASRSTSRFYGYKVCNGEISAYLKFGNSREEASVLKREFMNTQRGCEIKNRTFEVPAPIAFHEMASQGCAIAEYRPLPSESKNVPITKDWLDKVAKARTEIAAENLSHGDFMWHNLRVANGKIWILDWEELASISEERPSMTDEISFWTALDHFQLRHSIDDVYAEFKRRYADPEMRRPAFVALESMASRKIAMGEILLNRILGERDFCQGGHKR